MLKRTILLLVIINSFGVVNAQTKDLYLGVSTYGLDDNTELTYGFNIGYNVSKYFSVEMDYSDFGTELVGDGRGDDSTKGYSFILVAKYPISDFALYGKFGQLWYSQSGSRVSGDDFTKTYYSNSDSDFIYGIGVSYDFTEDFSLRLESKNANNVIVNGESLSAKELNEFSIGMDYNF